MFIVDDGLNADVKKALPREIKAKEQQAYAFAHIVIKMETNPLGTRMSFVARAFPPPSVGISERQQPKTQQGTS